MAVIADKRGEAAAAGARTPLERILLLTRCVPRGSRTAPKRGNAMNIIRNYLQHRLNPMHMYCRLMDFGLARRNARRLCSVYERFIYRGLLFH
ncbi:hypothetical protein DMR_13980 [Solidesulfovibrio magneticus RS-1]|uniref:Uncharacterized protein n=2 Tax=Solidesulfovibrio magneticus TaxID=184917 RepID=C4XMU8_SOLM1|nr:hypothetical protein DMR_13980 [Solidesulfovibrio magneticus RS-1]